jgi:hypothetical protein
MSKTIKDKSASVTKIGLIGVGLTAGLEFVNLTNQDLVKSFHAATPIFSAFIYECWGWLSVIATPESAETIRARKLLKKSIKQIDKDFKNPNNSKEFNASLQKKREDYQIAIIESYSAK